MKQKMKTRWNFELFYKNERDPQIEKDIISIENSVKSFVKKWGNDTRYVSDQDVLLVALKDYEKMYRETASKKPYFYFFLITQVDKKNTYALSQLSKIQADFAKLDAEILFFTVRLGKAEKSFQKKVLADARFEKYHYALERAFINGEHTLSVDEEKMITRLAGPSYIMWIEGVERVLSDKTISWKGKNMTLGEAGMTMPLLPRKDRLAIRKLVVEQLQQVAPFAEAEVNAVFTEKKIEDELRRFEHPYSQMILENENDESQIIRLVDLITKSFPIAHRFFKLKKEMLGIEGNMGYVDIHARVGAFEKKFDFEESLEITRSAFADVDQEFADILDRFVERGQIDVDPRVGKRDGAFCASMPSDVPTFVMLNHVPSFNGLKTLAHEMGHAIHAVVSKSQPVFYQSHTLSTAETASTLFENFVFDEVYKTLSDKEKIIALHDQIQDSIATIFRQICFFNFEKDLHKMIRSEGFVSGDKISALMNRHTESYAGKVLKLNPEDGLSWIQLSHMRIFFYVYTYAYGELVSKAMYAKYKQDKSFATKIKKFLVAGGSDTPENIFKSIGIDTSKEEFWMAGLKSIEDDIAELERLVKAGKKHKKVSKKSGKKK